MTTSLANNLAFRGFFEKQKLIGPNFIDWYRQLRIVLSVEDKLNYLEHPIPAAPVPAQAGQQVALGALAAHAARVKGSKEIAGIMLMTMESDIQRNLENLGAYEMLQELKTLFAQQAEEELLQTMQEFHSCKQEEGYMGKTINELHDMLKLHEQTLPKNNAHALHAIRVGKVQKGNNKHKKLQPQLAARGQNQGKRKNKLAYALKPKFPPPPKREDPPKDLGASGSGIFTIELSTFPNKSWVYDTGCGTHICNTTQGLRGSKKLKPDALRLYVGNEFLDHLKDHGIIAHRTPPYTPQHNGVSERRNRTLLDMVQSMMSQTTLPKSFWDYALETAARILNMVLTKKALVKRDTLTKPDKLEPRSIKCIFIGYPKETMGYSFYYPPENKVLVARNAKFLENSLITQEASGSLEDLEIIQEEDTHPSIDTSLHREEDDLEIDKP
ncbi:zinc finger, CCHC-type containing protein [Tanacetum coccineum]